MNDEPQQDSCKEIPSPTQFIDSAVGRRYSGCRLDNYDTSGKDSDAKQNAKDIVLGYVTDFPKHFESGSSLVLVGAKGTGKDHLMVAAIREIAKRMNAPSKVIFRDGLRLYSEFRAAFSSTTTEDEIVDKYIRPHLLAISDPVPPDGMLSEHEKRMALRIIDGRYREKKPMVVTINAGNREEITERLGSQATDRLLDDAIIVRCNWVSYRSSKPNRSLS